MERLIFRILRYSLLKFVYVIDQSCHPLVVHPLLRKILDPPLIVMSSCPWDKPVSGIHAHRGTPGRVGGNLG